jgi:predicted phage terminase large subunit-like protein
MSYNHKQQMYYREAVKASFLLFNRYFHKKLQNQSFIVSDHHEQIIKALYRVYNGETKRLIINIAPRYGKTQIAVKNFIAWCLANNPSASFIHLSYSDTLALDNSEAIRDIVTSAEYQLLFPEVKIKKDSNAKNKWYTDQGGGVYATATGGQITGFGAGAIQPSKGFDGAIIIDDAIKPDDAESSIIRERINQRYDSTIKNRVNSRETPIIVIGQRLHPKDLCGYLIEDDTDEWEVVKIPVINDNETALWPFKHTLEDLYSMRQANTINFERQYMQDPAPREGILYSEFKTYVDLPLEGRYKIEAYVDTADTGSDYLCSIVYLVKDELAYLIDVLYTQKPMEDTEILVSDQLDKYDVSLVRIESNNGGRGFARNVERILTERKVRCVVKWFHQSGNKESRIFSQSASVQNFTRYPKDWESRWNEFSDSLKRYMAKGKNKHDDAQDALTGVIENTIVKESQGTSSSGIIPRHKSRRL